MHWRNTAGHGASRHRSRVARALAAEDATLAEAAEDGNGAAVRTLVDGGAEVNAAQVDGMTALHWATYRDDAESAALLIRAAPTSTRSTATACRRYRSLRRTVTRASSALLLDAGADRSTSARRRNGSHDAPRARAAWGGAGPTRPTAPIPTLAKSASRRPHVGRGRRACRGRCCAARCRRRLAREARVRVHADIFRRARRVTSNRAHVPRGGSGRQQAAGARKERTAEGTVNNAS